MLVGRDHRQAALGVERAGGDAGDSAAHGRGRYGAQVRPDQALVAGDEGLRFPPSAETPVVR